MNLTLVPATDADFEFLFDLRRQALKPYMAESGWDEAAQREKFAADFSTYNYQLVHMHDQAVASVAVTKREHEIFLAELCVSIAWRGRGIASQLMRDLKIRAHQLNLPIRIYIDANNLDAQDFCLLQQFEELFDTEGGTAFEWNPEAHATVLAA